MTNENRNQPARAQEDAQPIMPPEEISEREEEAAADLPPADRASVERSAGEGLVGNSVEASIVPTEHIEAEGQLLSDSGQRVAIVDVQLQVAPPGWSGTLTTRDNASLAINRQYRLRIKDGREGILRVQERAQEIYIIQGVRSLQPADRQPDR